MKLAFFFMICLTLLLAISTVSALEFDNTYNYNETTKTAVIHNCDFWLFGCLNQGEILAEASLVWGDTKTGVGIDTHVGTFNYTSYSNANIQELDLVNLKNGQTMTRGKQYKVKTITQEDNFKTVCTNTTFINGSLGQECEQIEDGKKDVITWVPLSNPNNNLIQGQEYEIGVFIDTEEGDLGDWIPTFAGVEVKEWATWESSLNTNIQRVYNLNENTGTTSEDEVNAQDATLVQTSAWVTGKIGSGVSMSHVDYVTYGGMVEFPLITSTGDFTYSFWLKPSASWTTNGDHFLSQSDESLGYNDRLFTGSGGTWYIYIGGASIALGSPASHSGVWENYILERSGSTISLYNQNSLVSSGTSSATLRISNFGGRSTKGAGNSTGVLAYDGAIDLLYYWDRALTSDERTNIYNGNSANEYVGVAPDTAPKINLNSPLTNNTYNTFQNLEFSYAVTEDSLLSNVKFYVNDVLNQTNTTGINNTNYIFNLSVSDGDYIVYATATDNASQTNNSFTSRVQIDTIAPSLNITAPTTDIITESLPQIVTLNASVSDTHLDKCSYYTSDNVTNITYTCNTATNISFNTGGSKTIYAIANDTFNNTQIENTTIYINYITENAIYDASVIEQEDYTVSLNVTATNLTSINGTLHYNGVDYNTTVSINGSEAILSTNLTAPALNDNLEVTFNWTYNLNGVEYNSSNYDQIIFQLTPLFFATSCNDKALRFEIQDEANGTVLTGDVEFNFKYGLSNGTANEAYGSLSGVSTFYGCINATVSPNYTIGYGEIQYRVPGYVDRRYYLFEGNIISNETLTNVTLRDLKSTDQTSFILELEDTSLNKYTNKYTALWRWYPDLNEYKIVEMGKTDEEGQTVAHVNTEDVDYRLGLYETEGTLIKLGDPKRYVCTLSPCTFTLTVDAEDIDYSSLLDVQAEITFNETSKIFTLIYNDPNQYTSLMRLEVTRETGENSLIICNESSTGFSGALNCDTSAYTGFMRAVAYRSASPEAPVAQKTNTTSNRSWSSSLGLFISIILWLAVILSGLGSSPVLTVILSVVALIPALVFGAINFAIFTGVAVLGAIVLHFIKRALAF